jgi:starch synthase (maltosyl-transferring)
MLRDWAQRIRAANAQNATDRESGGAIALAEQGFEVIQRYPDRQFATRYEKPLAITVDREKARFSAWYELFPRSCSSQPIGCSFRKGKNNSPSATKLLPDVLLFRTDGNVRFQIVEAIRR